MTEHAPSEKSGWVGPEWQEASLSMAVACVVFAWNRDPVIGSAIRADIIREYGWTEAEWDEKVGALADYADRKGETSEDADQFRRVAYTGGQP